MYLVLCEWAVMSLLSVNTRRPTSVTTATLANNLHNKTQNTHPSLTSICPDGEMFIKSHQFDAGQTGTFC